MKLFPRLLTKSPLHFEDKSTEKAQMVSFEQFMGMAAPLVVLIFLQMGSSIGFNGIAGAGLLVGLAMWGSLLALGMLRLMRFIQKKQARKWAEQVLNA